MHARGHPCSPTSIQSRTATAVSLGRRSPGRQASVRRNGCLHLGFFHFLFRGLLNHPVLRPRRLAAEASCPDNQPTHGPDRPNAADVQRIRTAVGHAQPKKA
jgi:hypothetical protein